MPVSPATIGGAGREVTVFDAQTGRLPPLDAYIRDIWSRRRFVMHLARSNLKAEHTDTVFGQLWQVLNPLLLGMVYFFVVMVLRGGNAPPDYLSYLMGGLFLYYYFRNAMGTGANSVVAGGTLLLNSAFPRAILPLSTTFAATYNYIPTFIVYLGFHLAGGRDLQPTMLLLPLFLIPLSAFAFGLSLLSATVTVYFRDTTSFLPYTLRIWLYLSPVILTYDELVLLVVSLLTGSRVRTIEDAPAATVALAEKVVYINPLVSYLQIWHALVDGRLPGLFDIGMAIAWAVAALAIGGWFFLTREREFAFRV